jgi:hypothetical protein
MLTTPGHVTTLIGYGRDVNSRLFFVRSDEGATPYERVYLGDDPLGEWVLLFVPLPGRIYLAAETAELVARSYFSALLRRKEHAALHQSLRAGKMRLRLRTYATRSGEYKARLKERGVPDDVADRHRLISTSNWIWVVELQDPKLSQRTRRCVIGEVVIDATSDPIDPNVLFGNLPGRHYSWANDWEPLERRTEHYRPYLSDTALHDAPTASAAEIRPLNLPAAGAELQPLRRYVQRLRRTWKNRSRTRRRR